MATDADLIAERYARTGLGAPDIEQLQQRLGRLPIIAPPVWRRNWFG
jgi:hypothetical protein